MPPDGPHDDDRTLVRPAASADLPAISGARVRSWQAGYAGLLPVGHLAGLTVEDDLARRRAVFADTAGIVDTFVAERDGVVLGFASCGPYRPAQHAAPDPGRSEGEVYALYVEPAHWGEGAGRRLLAAALGRLAERGLTPVRLWTLAGNTRARRFYAAAGFVPDGATGSYRRDGLDAPEVRYTRG